MTSSASADTSIQSRLPELMNLARQTDSSARRTLLRELTDNFFGAPERTPIEQELYGVVLSDISRAMEIEVRAQLAERFASASDAPHQLIKQLANDEAAVAVPVLSRSPVLTDDDLIHVIRTRNSQEHIRAVTKREHVPEAVSDAIVEHGDDDTLHALLSNEGARLSRAASESAVDRAKANPDLHDVTVSRASLPIDLLNEMYFEVEERLRAKILEENARLDPEALEEALAVGRTRVATDDGSLPPDYAESLAYVEELRSANQLTPQTLARFLRSGSRSCFLIALSQLADIDFHTARNIVERRELDALAVVCRAADLDKALFLTYAVVLLNNDGNAMGKARSYASMYTQLDRDTALRTLRFWRTRRAVMQSAA
ncbi:MULTISPECIES: DUF2336 domain-containing protein [unclassified Brevundimonas]|uniref:DUF2336 domain-containing protein n=1 Tax=unclassified Brevundimonas TaxID=2622653 RepID=UPI0025BD4E54|nr:MULTISPECIES: DUF2336 domain-containing protein [unclassified Brevundimonas]